MRLLHLSDTHLPAATGPDEDGVDARAILDGLLHDCRHLTDIDVVVVSGDIADDGSTEGYQDALAAVRAYAASKDAAAVFCVGNHDDRSNFEAVLGTGHYDPDGKPTGHRLVPERCAAASQVDGLRLITLDSLVPGEVHGQIPDDELAALTTQLQQPAPRGSVVVLHHPPIALDGHVWRSVNLRDVKGLVDALAGSDVRLILCGHNHLQLSGNVAGVPVWATPGVISRIDLTAPPRLERAVTGAGATLIDLDGPSGLLLSVLQARDPHQGRQVYLIDAVTGADVPAE